jgi:hypothetical protein
MLLPKRYIPTPKEEPKTQEVKVIESVEPKVDTQALLSEIKKMLPKRKSAPSYSFDIIYNDEQRPVRVIARPISDEVII